MDIMLDLETLGTKPGCAVLSIGAKVFDPYADGTQPPVPPRQPFYRNIDLFTSLMVGLTVDEGTLTWWRKQDKAAQDALFPSKVSPLDAIGDFIHWLNNLYPMTNVNINIWAKSPGFDCHVLEHVANLVELPLPWDFRNFRDVRTIVAASGIDEKSITATGTGRVHHNALDDCDVQILLVQAAYRKLNLTPSQPLAVAGVPIEAIKAQ
jgi:hypothetical protein